MAERTLPLYSYDDPGFDPGLKALLDHVRRSSLTDTPFDEVLALLIGRDMPRSVAALLHTQANHSAIVDLALYELAAPRTLDDHAGRDDIVAALEALGIPGDNALQIGSTGGGEETLLIGWKSADDAYTILSWDNEAALYDNDEPLTQRGSFEELFIEIYRWYIEDSEREAYDFPEDLEALLRATGHWERDHIGMTYAEWEDVRKSGLSMEEWLDQRDDEE